MSCKVCGCEKQTIPAGEYWPAEEVLCEACRVKESDQKQRHIDMAKYATSLLGFGGASESEFIGKMLGHFTKPTRDEIAQCWKLCLECPNTYKRGTSYFIRRNFEPELKIGSRIWRNVQSGTEIMPMPSSDNCVAIYDQVWHALPGNFKGLRCFVSNNIPDWTYLEVTGFSVSGKAAFVRAVAGPEDELLQAWWWPCGKCGVRQAINIRGCENCKRLERDTRLVEEKIRVSEERGYVTHPKTEARFVCRACVPKAPRGSGKCAICRKDYV